MINFYIGYDSKQPYIAEVCYSSMLKWVSVDKLHFIKKENLSIYNRPEDPNQATEFSFTRFLTPYLNSYEGWAVFCDADFLWMNDPNSLKKYLDPNLAVQCVQHNISFEQLSSQKMDGKSQIWYPKKNWSSLMLLNCSHPLLKKLTPEVVNTSSASYLHQLDWAKLSIGNLPITYNFLVGYYPSEKNIHAYHFTDGVPLHPGYENCEYNELWLNEYNKMNNMLH